MFLVKNNEIVSVNCSVKLMKCFQCGKNKLNSNTVQWFYKNLHIFEVVLFVYIFKQKIKTIRISAIKRQRSIVVSKII